MPSLKFRHRIALLVLLPATALVLVVAVTLELRHLNKQRIRGVEEHYLPLIELDGSLGAVLERIPTALEHAAATADAGRLAEADQLAGQLRAGLVKGAPTIRANGGQPEALRAQFDTYYQLARDRALAVIGDGDAADLAGPVDGARVALDRFTSAFERATTPDYQRVRAAFRDVRETQNRSLWLNLVIAVVVLALTVVLSRRLIRRTVAALHAVSDSMKRMARGDVGHPTRFPPGDELGDLAREADRTAVTLREYRERVERAAWIESGVAELAEQIAGEVDATRLAEVSLRYLVRRAGARAGRIHVADDTSEPTVLATVGEVAATNDGRVVRVPLVHQLETAAVVELVTDDGLDARAAELLTRVRAPLGAAFVVAEARRRESALLLETKRQAHDVRTANAELEAFSYSVSHDLRTPLRGIDGFSQALLEDYDGVLDDTGRDYLRRVRAAAQRMAELIDDLLRLARVSRTDLHRDQVDLSAMAASVASELQRAAPGRAVELRIQPDVAASADPRLVRITFENLLGNAWKFTSKADAVVIEFGVGVDGDVPVYFVRDNGAGFDMQFADRLFGAFQRLHTEREFPGTGIGLATVQRIIQRHGGRIWVEAAVGQGAAFYFTLPPDPTEARSP